MSSPLPTVPLPPPVSPMVSVDEHSSRPLQVYARHRPVPSTAPDVPTPPSLPAAPSPMSTTTDSDLPIALRKGKRSCTAHPLANSLSFNHFSPSFRSFAVSLSSTFVPKSYHDAVVHPEWKSAMDEEISTLLSRHTWDLVSAPIDADVVSCRWVFTLKYHTDGTIARYKARLVARGYTQTYGVDYFETFSPVARLNSIRVLFSLAVNQDWPMYQTDVKNAFLYGDLTETVFMEQPPRYVAQGERQHMVCKLNKVIYGLKQSPRAWFDKFSKVINDFGFHRCQADHFVFVKRRPAGSVILVVCVDDILIYGSDIKGIEKTKAYLQQHFVTKDMGQPKYFLGIEIAHSKNGISLSQRKYALDLLQETGLLGTKPIDTPIELNSEFWNDNSPYFRDKAKYRRIVGN